MKNFFNIITIVSAVIMIATILLQSRGAGLGASFGGEGNFYRSRRGAEKAIFNLTIIAAVVFVLSVLLGILSKS
ncbi:MAG TPA: preprotein translocase subunit SecG [Candidatus Nanoarchaeia archaeon]|nr:preprotein translocase subunit SecG [Candidatus Nanoarchaeia archaeon]